MTGSERVLFVHAHPDDETISTGGTIATLVDRGAAVTVVTCTSGERGEVIPDELSALRGDPAAIAAERRSELSRAMTILGVTDHRYLGEANARWAGLDARRYTDSGMRWGSRGAEAADDVAPDSLTAAEAGEVSADIAAVIQDVQPDVVVSYDEYGGYGHPDHVRAHHSARVAAEVMGVPFFAIERPGTRGATMVDVAPVLDRKRAALAEYRTQLTVEGDTFVTPSGDVESIDTVESFRRVRTGPAPFTEHSIPSRIAACLVALVIGALAGATLTVVHQAAVLVADVPVP